MNQNKKLAIIADSTHDFTFELGKRFNVEVLSYYIQMDDHTYKDLVDIDSRTFYEKMENYDVLSTGIPPMQDIIDLLNRLKNEGYQEVLMISSAAKLTGMYNLHALTKENYSELDIYVFNTNQIAAGTAHYTIKAAQLRDQGYSAEEIIKQLEPLNKSIHTYALFRTLKYVVKGGRFNKYAGLIGNLLNINPLLYLDDGEMTIQKKVRGTRKSLTALAAAIRKDIGDAKHFNLFVFSGNNQTEITELKDMLSDLIARADLFLETELTPVLGVHAGPKSIGISAMLHD